MDHAAVNNKYYTKLRQGVTELGLEAEEHKLALLLQYAGLLVKWNKVYSLTAITDFEQILILHLLDGLTVIQYLQSVQSILDVGSGMGVPGIVIAIWCPHIKVCVLDINHKKAAFLRQIAIELKLVNLTVVCESVEKYMTDKTYDLAISRAFSSAIKFITCIKHLSIKRVMLMKSRGVEDELAELAGYKYKLIELALPFCNDRRALLEIEL